MFIKETGGKTEVHSNRFVHLSIPKKKKKKKKFLLIYSDVVNHTMLWVGFIKLIRVDLNYFFELFFLINFSFNLII